MRKSVIAIVVLAVAVFGAGYLIGQMGGVTSSSAAGSNPPQQTQPQQTHPDGPWAGHWANAGPRADGTVTAINGDTLTVKADSDQGQTGEYSNVTSIVLTSSTQYVTCPGSTATAGKSSIKVGSHVVASGTLSADGKTLTASSVLVRPDGSGAFRGDNGTGFNNAPAFFGGNDGGPSA